MPFSGYALSMIDAAHREYTSSRAPNTLLFLTIKNKSEDNRKHNRRVLLLEVFQCSSRHAKKRMILQYISPGGCRKVFRTFSETLRATHTPPHSQKHSTFLFERRCCVSMIYFAFYLQIFRSSACLFQVAAELEAQHVNPIAADGLVLDSMLERAFDLAHEVKSKQTALTAEQGARDGQIEQVFFAGILFQRDQVTSEAEVCRQRKVLVLTLEELVYGGRKLVGSLLCLFFLDAEMSRFWNSAPQ